MSSPLEILFGKDKAGVLAWHSEKYVYSSLTGPPALTAPSRPDVRRKPAAEAKCLPTFLEVSIPEGYMRQSMLARLEKLAEPEDMRLLRAVGGNMIGLVSAIDRNRAPYGLIDSPVLDIATTLQMDQKKLLDLAFAHAGTWPGISGGFMKLLVTTSPEPPLRRAREWIVKLADDDRAGLCVIEHFGMRAAKSMGLEVPETILSDDCSRLLVERFDIDASGKRLGFEDMCSLSGAPAADKYASSAERIVGILEATCDSKTVAASKEAFFAQYLLASVIRNGDAHLKNFGVLYGKDHLTALSPVYDMVSMAVYAPKRNDGDAADGMALTLNGSRRWPSAQMLSELARRCSISRDKEIWWHERLQFSLLQVGVRAAEMVCQRNISNQIRASVIRMLELWGFGIRSYSVDAANRLSEIVQTLTGK